MTMKKQPLDLQIQVVSHRVCVPYRCYALRESETSFTPRACLLMNERSTGKRGWDAESEQQLDGGRMSGMAIRDRIFSCMRMERRWPYLRRSCLSVID